MTRRHSCRGRRTVSEGAGGAAQRWRRELAIRPYSGGVGLYHELRSYLVQALQRVAEHLELPIAQSDPE